MPAGVGAGSLNEVWGMNPRDRGYWPLTGLARCALNEVWGMNPRDSYWASRPGGLDSTSLNEVWGMNPRDRVWAWSTSAAAASCTLNEV